MRFTREKMQQLVGALTSAFPSYELLDMMLQFRLEKPLSLIAAPGSLQIVAFKVVEKANSEGWALGLVNAALQSNPGNEELSRFSQSIGFILDPAVNLEVLIDKGNAFQDVGKLIQRLSELHYQVCKVEIPMPGGSLKFGSGCLIGPDWIITNYHVMVDVITEVVPAEAVTIRFDYKVLPDGKTIDPGTPFRLHRNWLVDYSPFLRNETQQGNAAMRSEEPALDYALVRIASEAGKAAVGSKHEVGAKQRGWMTPRVDHSFAPQSPLFILQHPNGKPLKVAMATNGIIGLTDDRTRVRYRTNTEPGSSGSPCFNQDWDLVALHHAGDPVNMEYNQGIPFSEILRNLARPAKNLMLPPACTQG